ncbi:amidohydrolase family protein [Klenkia brasiliensis]|uniref:Imidazolonepropionase n=1 Tax=Klenkia brasiliensis TaxID=333142 RepID=A0A1G7SVG6_9ACTN|nr:amidohydrolase family protein [Klenkia brasiliensis]SDG26774.1 Imidazolonepropionase [Klenkia brasiliensis]
MTTPAPDGTGRLAVLAGTLVPGDGRPPLTDAVLLAADGRITWVGRRTGATIPDDALVLDARDGWVVPGLVEGHAHITSFAAPAYHPDAPPPFHDAPLLLDAFARWGITTIRDTGGPELRALRTLQTHTGPWPRLFGSGPNLDGRPGGPWKGMWKTDDPAEAVEFVAREADAGVDFIKVYAWMTADVLAAVTEASHRRGLKVAGHVGHLVSGLEAVRLGVDALEHVRIGRELLDDAGRAAVAALPVRPRDAMADTRAWRYLDPDGDAVGAAIDVLLEHGTWLTPTLAVHEAILGGTGHDHDHGHGAPDGVAAAIGLHHDATSARGEASAEDRELGPVELDRICRFVARAHAAGVRICAGSDTPSGSVPPGSGVHRELELLVAAGISPAEALRSATSRTAELLGRTGSFGSLVPGSEADLVVLDHDPLADVSATRTIRTVLRSGRQLHTAVPAAA